MAGVTTETMAAEWAAAQVERVRDDPAGRMALTSRAYNGPIGNAPRHLPFRRAALSFMRWQAERGVLRPLDANPPGSPWWRAVNDRLLLDGCEALARSGFLARPPRRRSRRGFGAGLRYRPSRSARAHGIGLRPARARVLAAPA